jgi:signal transduction histidine kinase
LISLVDATRQWIKSRFGIEAPETSREASFCAHAILEDGIFEVPNALEDVRFADNPLVTGPPHVCFYAGAPLRTAEGLSLGTLCVMDRVPRHLTEKQRSALARLARQVVCQLELRGAHRDLRQTAGFQKAILDSAAASIISTTPEGIITSFSRGSENLLGYTAEEVVGKFTPEFIHEPAEVELRAEVLTRELGRVIEPGFKVFVAKLLNGHSDTCEWTYVRKDSSRVPVLLSVSAMRDAAGALLGYLGVASDITERNQAEARLRRSYTKLTASREELLSANENLRLAHGALHDVQFQLVEAEKMKSIGRLAAGVAHEVKNPLAVLKVGLEILSAGKTDDGEKSLILHEMTEAIQSADRVVFGLLDFSAPKQVEMKHENLNAIINVALTLVRGGMKGAFEAVCEFDPHLPRVGLDVGKISQVFVNLFTNALNAMGNGGTLTVRTYAKQLNGVGVNISDSRSESFRVGRTVVIAEIDDTGVGIPEDKLPKIFEPFFTTKPTGKGTGLGLAVVKTIIDLHGATIDVRNRHRGGVRVTLTFPVSDQPKTET